MCHEYLLLILEGKWWIRGSLFIESLLIALFIDKYFYLPKTSIKPSVLQQGMELTESPTWPVDCMFYYRIPALTIAIFITIVFTILTFIFLLLLLWHTIYLMISKLLMCLLHNCILQAFVKIWYAWFLTRISPSRYCNFVDTFLKWKTVESC